MKKGISLVALVVTIIVMIILTGAVIATFMEGGIIERSNEAVKGNDYTTLVEAYTVKEAEAKIDYEVDGIAFDKISVLEETTDELELSKDFKYENGSVEYIGENERIGQWVTSNFTHKELADLGYTLSLIDGEVYMTGIKYEGENITTTVADIVPKLGTGYEIVNANGDKVESGIVTTGYQIIKDEEVYATIVMRTDNNGNGSINSIDAGDILRMVGTDREIEKAILLSADINNDGIISQDDYLLRMQIDFNSLKIEDEIVFTKIPTVATDDKTLYTWYTTEDLIKKLNKYYNIQYDEILILEEGTTVKTLEEGIEKALNIDNIRIGGAEGELRSGDGIDIYIPVIISETEYSNASLYFDIEIE